VLQEAFLTYEAQKTSLIKKLIAERPEAKSILIFTSTKRKVNDIVRGLRGGGYKVEGISSDLEQTRREDVLRGFRSKQTRVLIATDVLSRGIDIKDIDIVINYDVPGDAEDYVHRVGRTARAATTGLAITLINEDDMYKFSRIEALIGKEVTKLTLPGDMGEGPAWKPNQRGGGNRRFSGKKRYPRKGGGNNKGRNSNSYKGKRRENK